MRAADNVFGARQLADRLAAVVPRLGGGAAHAGIRGPAGRRSGRRGAQLPAALALRPPEATCGGERRAADARGEPPRIALRGCGARAFWPATSRSRSRCRRRSPKRDATPDNRLDYALLLLAAQQTRPRSPQLDALAGRREAAPGGAAPARSVEFQDGKLEAASRALHGTAGHRQVRRRCVLLSGPDRRAAATIRRGPCACTPQVAERRQRGAGAAARGIILQAHGAAPAAEDLLDQLIEDEPQRAPEILAARARIYSDAGDLAHAHRGAGAAACSSIRTTWTFAMRIASTSEDQGRIERRCAS